MSGLGEIIDNSRAPSKTESLVGSLTAMKPNEVLHAREDGTEITVGDLLSTMEARLNDPAFIAQVEAVFAQHAGRGATGDSIMKALAENLPIEK